VRLQRLPHRRHAAAQLQHRQTKARRNIVEATVWSQDICIAKQRAHVKRDRLPRNMQVQFDRTRPFSRKSIIWRFLS
jgi:hypothetical protein